MNENRENSEFNRMYLLSPAIFKKFIEIYDKIEKFNNFEKEINNVLIDNNLSSISKLKIYQDLLQNRIAKNTSQRRIDQEKTKLGQQITQGQDFRQHKPIAFSSPLKNSALLSHRDDQSRIFDSFNESTVHNLNEAANGDEIQNSDANSYQSAHATLNESRNDTVRDQTISSLVKRDEILKQMKLHAIAELETSDEKNLVYEGDRYDRSNGYTQKYI